MEFDVEHGGFVELAELRDIGVQPFLDNNRSRVDFVNDTSTTRDAGFGRACVHECNGVADGKIVNDHERVSEGFSFLVCINYNRPSVRVKGDWPIFSGGLIVD